jgi:cation diffusion facilitator CzcD-associated flavoprotein CzcO
MRIAIIGAGASGLAAAKKLLDQGITPVVYERTCRAPTITWKWTTGATSGISGVC